MQGRSTIEPTTCQDRMAALHDLFTAESRLYAEQTARAKAQAEMNDFLHRLAV